LYDKERKGSLDFKTFTEVCEDLGVYLSKNEMVKFFKAASEDGKSVSFNDFAKTMRRENYH
jgi:Ca2+-binding EF-hand superfamily protein